MKTPQIAALPGMSPLGLPITETARHTPGPWRAMPDGAIQKDAAMPTGAAVIAYAHHWDEQRMRANAALIAAAPELLAALNSALSWITVLTETSPGNAEDMREMEHKRDYLGAELRAAIAAVEGR